MPEIKPRQFNGLAAFTARCERAVEVDPEALILFGHTRRLKRDRIKMTREGPEAVVVGWDAEAVLTVLEVRASAALAVIRAGHFVDRFDLTQPRPQPQPSGPGRRVGTHSKKPPSRGRGLSLVG